MTETRPKFNYLRQIDAAAVAALGANDRLSQNLVGQQTGTTSCSVHHVCTPPGGASPSGRHVHEVDQMVYIIEGTMEFDIDGETFQAGPGGLIVMPAGVPHIHWNAGTEHSIHLAINAPAPDLDEPFSRPAPRPEATRHLPPPLTGRAPAASAPHGTSSDGPLRSKDS